MLYFVEDDSDDMHVYERVSQLLKIDVKFLADGESLIAALNEAAEYPKIIFLDLNLHLKSGYDILQMIKQQSEFKQIPIVVLSSGNDPASILRSWQLGANLYVTKPNTLFRMKAIVKELLVINWQTFYASADDFVYRSF